MFKMCIQVTIQVKSLAQTKIVTAFLASMCTEFENIQLLFSIRTTTKSIILKFPMVRLNDLFDIYSANAFHSL